jgi:hypothetical protein
MLTINGMLNDSLVLTYRTSPGSVADMLPEGLRLYTVEDQAFWNVSVSRITQLRYGGLPRWMGVTCHHVSYRLLVHAPEGSDYRAPLLYQVKAQTDSALIRRVSDQLRVPELANAAVDLTLDDQVMLLKVHSPDPEDSARLCAGLRVAPQPPAGALLGSLGEALDRLPVLSPCVYMGVQAEQAGQMGHTELGFDPTALHVSQVHVFDAQWGPLLRLNQRRLTLEMALRVAPLEVTWHLNGPGRPAAELAPNTPRLQPQQGLG